MVANLVSRSFFSRLRSSVRLLQRIARSAGQQLKVGLRGEVGLWLRLGLVLTGAGLYLTGLFSAILGVWR